MSKLVEYQVRPVTRYIVTRWFNEDDGNGLCAGGCSGRGQFDNLADAIEVATALHKLEQEHAQYEVRLISEGDSTPN
jgi:hypothetical protein